MSFKMSNEERREVIHLKVGRQQRIERMRKHKQKQSGFDFEPGEVGELF